MPLKALNVSKKSVISQVNLTSGKMEAERQPDIRLLRSTLRSPYLLRNVPAN